MDVFKKFIFFSQISIFIRETVHKKLEKANSIRIGVIFFFFYVDGILVESHKLICLESFWTELLGLIKLDFVENCLLFLLGLLEGSGEAKITDFRHIVVEDQHIF